MLAGYVTLTVQRWDKIRNDYFGKMWGSLEANVLIAAILCPGFTPHEEKMADRLSRYNRLVMRLLFFAGRGHADLTSLVPSIKIAKSEENLSSGISESTADHVLDTDVDLDRDAQYLLSASEMKWLNATSVGTRPLTIILWIERLMSTMVVTANKRHRKVEDKEISTAGLEQVRQLQKNIYMNLDGVRGGAGATLGIVKYLF